MSKKASVQRPVVSRTPEAIARELVAQVDLVPDYTEIGDAEDERALVAAYITHYVEEDAQAELLSFDADEDRDMDILTDALPDQLRPVLCALLQRRDTMLWVKGEIAYRLGIEVGKRLDGGAR
jgi:hypothetical protein